MWYKYTDKALLDPDAYTAAQGEPVVVVPLDQWKRLVELAAAWNSGDCCAAIADDMASIIAAVEVPDAD